MTTVTSTASALTRKQGGNSDVAVSKHVSGPVLADPLNTKATNTLADQATRTKVAPSVTRVLDLGNGDGAKTAFAIVGHLIRNPANVTFKVAGTVTAGTLSTDRKTVTFSAAPANGALVQLLETQSRANVDDATAAGPLHYSFGTRVNH